MAETNELHKRNKHNGMYDFGQLVEAYPTLSQFVAENKYGNLSIDFFNPHAVKALNKALLISCYGIESWDIPNGYLCPPIPGRADYIHYIADLIGATDCGKVALGPNSVRCLDIGVGANCIYPIIGCTEYGWQFVGTDIDHVSVANARSIVEANEQLRGQIEVRLQHNIGSLFAGVVAEHEWFDVSMCNPPFHGSKEQADRGTMRKLTNLQGRRATNATLNFGGCSNELWCSGGELGFLINMIAESREHSDRVGWFTTLVSKEDNLGKLRAKLRAVGVAEQRTIEMHQGNKNSRILAWRFGKRSAHPTASHNKSLLNK